MKIALICGGPSLERGISLNSARSLLDHLQSKEIEIVPFYLDQHKKPFQISTAQLYSNTPSDFDFKLKLTSNPLSNSQFIRALKKTDLVFPVMHGAYGEDGGIQSLLEKHRIPFVGASSAVCKKVFDKFEANQLIASFGFYTLPSALLKIHDTNHKKIITNFFKTHKLKRAIIKPAKGGSSIGVFSVGSTQEAIEKAKLIFDKRMDTRVVIEPFAQGTEFTVIILTNRFGLPVAIIPTEIETDYQEHQIFDFRKKYLPSRQVTYHCPPRFSNAMIEKIQVQAEQLYTALGMRDFSRFDGWVLPDGNIWFSDINPISGMEQNSFLFQQASRVGMTHADVLKEIIKQACKRYKIKFPKINHLNRKKRKPVYVLFGNTTAERQVSVMSGTNAWLKLRQSTRYYPMPFLLDSEQNVWSVPYQLALNHTVEEIEATCKAAKAGEERLGALENRVKLKLSLQKKNGATEFSLPQKTSLATFIKSAPYVFLGLHGGIGEDGTIQKLLAQNNKKYNGSDYIASSICIDKDATAKKIEEVNIIGIRAIPKKCFKLKELALYPSNKIQTLWEYLTQEFQADSVIAKPKSDGCSAGVVRLFSPDELSTYIQLLTKKNDHIPPNTFKNQTKRIELPSSTPDGILIEKFILTDSIQIKGNHLKYINRTGWIETTIGLIEQQGKMHSFNPSISVAEGEVLSVEEKFQGGTGINITPPPAEIIPPQTNKKIKQRIEKLASLFNLKGYARIDTFINIKTGELLVIEVNTLPALTPSTVLFHQALAEKTPKFPMQLLEMIIQNSGY